MTDSSDRSSTANCRNPRRARVAAYLLVAMLAPGAVASAQQAPPSNGTGMASTGSAQPAPSAPPAAAAAQPRGLFPAQPPPAQQPQPGGFIYAFGRWWDQAHGKLGDVTKPPENPVQGAVQATQGAAAATQDALKNAAQATQHAATALFQLPGLRVVEVHQRCSVAPNGAPDCRIAAANACRAKGFRDGHPVDVQSSENCPPAIWMSGREPKPGECSAETVVLMVACQQ